MNALKRFAPLTFAVALLLTLPGGVAFAADDKGQSTLDPAGPQAQHVADLFWIITIPALLVLVLVAAAIITAAIRFRDKGGPPKGDAVIGWSTDKMPVQLGGNNAIEFTWTVVPAFILMLIFVLTAIQMPYLRDRPSQAADALKITVVGRQWAWSFEYPNPGSTKKLTTFGEMIIPVGEVVGLDITSKDVIHSWSIPRLSGRLDAVPGQTNSTWVRADAIGTYYGQCTEFCGLSHAFMSAKVTVLSRADFDAWYTKKKQGGG